MSVRLLCPSEQSCPLMIRQGDSKGEREGGGRERGTDGWTVQLLHMQWEQLIGTSVTYAANNSITMFQCFIVFQSQCKALHRIIKDAIHFPIVINRTTIHLDGIPSSGTAAGCHYCLLLMSGTWRSVLWFTPIQEIQIMFFQGPWCIRCKGITVHCQNKWFK